MRNQFREHVLCTNSNRRNCFYFNDDPEEDEHYLGYDSRYQNPYWVGLCDIEGGCSFSSANELVNAPIYEGKTLKDGI